ncbi:MAG: hypothetical protein HY906_24610 [Deltaproteobacteria bacterium]|nr:hypothetical protein [Deltaproteobacteria bacterium]
MRKTILIGILVLLPAALAGGVSLLSCSQVECGTGTHEEGGKCVANLENECGPGTYSTGGQCVPVTGSPCGPNTSWVVDDAGVGLCHGSASAGDGGVNMRGARWNQFKMIKPESIATLANIQLPGYFADGTIVVILRTEPLDSASVWLHGGDGTKTSDDPLAYTFKEGFIPPSVLSYLDPAVTGTDGKTYTPFRTAAQFEWTFKFLPSQPPLYMYKASLTGKLDPDMIPTSSDPPGLSGTFKGCFTPTALEPGKYGAEDVYLDVLSQNLKQLIESSGGVIDTDCTGSGSNNGYLLEAQWESRDENMDLTPDTGSTDGGVETDAGTD